MSFSGRLTNSSGGSVPDGYYNIQFKIYQDGAGTSAGNSGGTLKWTENYVNNGGNNGVQVKNGYFSVNLGSRTAFGSSVDWNQDTLWLSMNVAGSSTSCSTFGTAPCSADGEMLPMKRLTSTPFALNSAQLGGRTADGFVQNTTTLQANTNLSIQSASDSAITAYLEGRTNQTSTSLLIKQGSSQTGKAFDIQDASNASLFNIDASGNLNAANDGTFGGHLGVGVAKDSSVQLKVTAQSGSVGALIIGDGTHNILQLNSGNGNTQVLSVADNGDTTIQNKTNSTTAFQIKDQSGNSYVTANSYEKSLTTGNVNVGDPTQGDGARIFSDGFESGDIKLWSGYTTSGDSSITAETSDKHGGKYSVRTLAAGNGAANFYKYLTGGSTTYVRGYVYIGSHNTSGGAALSLFKMYNGHSGYFALYRSGGGHLVARNDTISGGLIDYNNSVTLSTGAWHQIEMSVTASRTVGAMKVWLDGTQVVNTTGVDTDMYNPISLIVGTENGAEIGDVYYDDFAVDTVRPGDSGNLNVNDSLHVGGTASFGSNASFGSDVSIQGNVTTQGSLQIAGGITGATTIQGNTSVIAPLFDRADAGTLSIGTVNATTINLGTNNIDHTINIGTGTGAQTITIGSLYSSSSILLQGGDQGVRFESRGGFGFRNDGASYDALQIWQNGAINIQTSSGVGMYVGNSSGQNLFDINDDGTIQTTSISAFTVAGSANFQKGITIQGSTSTTEYISPVTGAHLHTAINVPNYTVPAYGSIFAFGLPSTSASTARGMVVADGRTGTHQATIGVLSPDENQVLGLSWKSDSGTGANQIGTLTNTANSLALQGNGLNLLTATNNAGAANVGIGNDASAGYALDVTGSIRASASIFTPSIDTASAGTLSVGTTNATTINIGTNNAAHTVNIATGTGTQTVNVGSTDSDSSTTINGGTNGVNIKTGDSGTAAGSISIDTGTGTATTSNVFNKTFESTTDGMASWYNSSVTTSTTQKHAGAKSLAVTASDPFWGIEQSSGSSVTAGRQYEVSAWTRAATAGRSITLRVVWNTGAYEDVALTNSTTSWTQLSETVTAPTGATTMVIQLFDNDGGSSVGEVHYFDDIVMTDLSANGSAQSVNIGAQNAARVTIGNGNQTGATNIYGGSGVNLQSANGINLNGNTTIASDKTLTANGSVLFQNATNSTTAFQIQRADGTAMFTADSTNQTITIGNSASGNYTVISTSTGQITKYGTARNTKKITLNAEYTGSVLDPGTGSNNTGVMTSSVDLTNRMNYYKWTTSQATNQSYDVVVQVPIPTDFDGWASSNPLSISTYTSNTTNGTITLEARDSSNAVQCNFVSVTPGSTGAWATNSSACTLSSGTYTAGDTMTLRIRLQSPTSGDVRVGNINLSYLSKY